MNFMHTKKFNISIVITFALCFLVGIVASAFAEENTATVTSKTSQVEPPKKELMQQKKIRVTNLAANISNRFDAIVTRLETIIIRIESRVHKLEQEGTDQATARMSIDKAKEALQDAHTQLATIDEKVNQVVTSENPRGKWGEIKQTFITIHKDIVEARQQLREAIIAMKKANAEKTNAELQPSTVREGSQSQVTP